MSGSNRGKEKGVEFSGVAPPLGSPNKWNLKKTKNGSDEPRGRTGTKTQT